MQNIIAHVLLFMAVLCNRAAHYIFAMWFLLSSFFLSLFFSRLYLSNRKNLVKQQYLLHMFPQYGELWSTSGWDRSGRLGTPANTLRWNSVTNSNFMALKSFSAWLCLDILRSLYDALRAPSRLGKGTLSPHFLPNRRLQHLGSCHFGSP